MTVYCSSLCCHVERLSSVERKFSKETSRVSAATGTSDTMTAHCKYTSITAECASLIKLHLHTQPEHEGLIVQLSQSKDLYEAKQQETIGGCIQTICIYVSATVRK